MQVEMQIQTQHYLRTFKEFCEIVEASGFSAERAVNETTKDHVGWTTSLYEVEDGLNIAYGQNRVWYVHYNGVGGQGLTLEQALADQKAKSDQVFAEMR